MEEVKLNPAENSAFKGTNRLLVGIVLSVLTYWLFALSLLNIAPVIQTDLGFSAGVISIGTSITGLFSGIFIVVAGGLADKVGRMKLTYVGLVFSIIGSALLVISQAAPLFILGRILQGLSAACIMPATMAIVKTYYHGRDRQRALSFWSMGSWGGSGLSSFFGGAIASSIGWRYVFVLSIVISICSGLLLWGTPECKSSEQTTGKFDRAGLGLFILSMVALNVVVSKGAEFGWFSPLTISLGVIVIVGCILFYKTERSKENSFIDFTLFENRGFLGATVSNFLLNAISGTVLVINSYEQQGRGLSAVATGVLSIGYLVMVLATIRVGERLLQKIGARKPMIWGMVLCVVGITLMALTFVSGFSYLVIVFIGYSLFGAGLGIYATPSTDTAVTSVPIEKVGVASGIYKMASSLGGALGVAISAAVYNGVSAATNFSLGADSGLLVNLVFCLLSILSVIFVIPKKSAQMITK